MRTPETKLDEIFLNRTGLATKVIKTGIITHPTLKKLRKGDIGTLTPLKKLVDYLRENISIAEVNIQEINPTELCQKEATK